MRLITRQTVRAMGLLASLLIGCATAGDAPTTSPGLRRTARAEPEDANQARLVALRQARRRDAETSDFSLGPGDVLEISVPDMAELKSAVARVSGDNTIALPLLGTVAVAGLTQDEVRERLRQRLLAYMHDPQVGVFVREYRSREVAVVGMVQKPGLYTMTSFHDTVLQMVSLAGGPTAQAASYVILIPASGRGGPMPPASMLTAPAQGRRRGPAPRQARAAAQSQVRPVAAAVATDPAAAAPLAGMEPGMQARAIVIDSSGAGAKGLDLPARPGDVVIVPLAGEVMVQGWVANPGAFNVVPGMTVLSAVAAAGGPMFSSSAQVLRPMDNGTKREFDFDLAQIQSGRVADLRLQSGDLVIVNRSVTGAMPYLVYEVFNKLGAGVYATPF